MSLATHQCGNFLLIMTPQDEFGKQFLARAFMTRIYQKVDSSYNCVSWQDALHGRKGKKRWNPCVPKEHFRVSGGSWRCQLTSSVSWHHPKIIKKIHAIWSSSNFLAVKVKKESTYAGYAIEDSLFSTKIHLSSIHSPHQVILIFNLFVFTTTININFHLSPPHPNSKL